MSLARPESEALALQVAGLSLHAGGRASARRLAVGLDFTLQAGERWVVLGPNGSGKSTLIATLAGLLPVLQGGLSLQQLPLSAWAPERLARWRAWCPQFWSDPFPARVDETVRATRRGWTADASARAPSGGAGADRGPGGHPRSGAEQPANKRAHSRRDAGPAADGFDALLQSLDLTALAAADVRQLSGGERQRVALAAVLWQDAPLLLLDEPTAHLDLAHQQQLLAVLQAHAERGGAVCASLHDVQLAWQLATHAVLFDGRGGAWAGPREEVMTPARLSAAFGVAIDRVAVCGEQRFWVGPAHALATVPGEGGGAGG
jgi:iron complex transport system ATP-binding protein